MTTSGTAPPEGAIRLIKSISSLRGLKRLTRALATSFLATVFPQFRPSLGAVLPGLVVASVPASTRESSASPCNNSPSSSSSSILSILHEALFSRWNSEPSVTSCEEQQRAGMNCSGHPVKMSFASGVPVIRRCRNNENFGGSSARTSFAFVSHDASPSSSLAAVRSLSTHATSRAPPPPHSSSSSSCLFSSSSPSDSHPNSSFVQRRTQQQQNQNQNQKQQTFSTSTSSSPPSKLSSTRAQNVLSLLPSYLLDARAITKYHPVHSPEGALQLSVAENQLSELPILDLDDANGAKVVALSEEQDDGANREGREGITVETAGEGMTLVDVVSQLARSTVPRPSSSTGLPSPQSQTEVRVFEKDMIYYQPTQGVPGVRNAMADYLQNLLVAPHHIATEENGENSETDGDRRCAAMDPENIILGAGCNAVLENLCMCLVEPGEAVMIPTPYYAAFEFDLVARAGCHIVPVNTFQHHPETPPQNNTPTVVVASSSSSHHYQPIPITSYYPNRSSLDQAYERTLAETSRPPRVLLLSHPNNPLGICYPPEVVKECIDWCREKEVHLISDEIYAGSVYRTERGAGADGQGATFVSAMALAANHDNHATSSSHPGLGLGPYIHLVYALSKDFALSGLRVGVAYTENPEILVPMQKLNDLCQISSQTQLLVERMLRARVLTADGDDDAFPSKKFVDVYLKSNQANIRSRCDKLQQCLDEVDIPYLPADSGLFVWMDFREFLPTDLEVDDATGEETLESKERRERQLYLSLMKEYGLLFTPGMSMRNEKAGFFRCVFTAASEEEFELGLERIRVFVEKERQG